MPCSFQHICVIQIGLSDFHLINLTVMTKNLKKKSNLELQIIACIIICQMNVTENANLIS